MDYLEQLNPQQKLAVSHWGAPLLILAGAGSGKTRVVTTKIAYLILEKKMSPLSILAVTFTNKAAAEMRERVASLTGSIDGLMIRTFHSFGAWLLRRYGEPLGLGRHFVIYDDNDMYSLLKKTVEKLPVRKDQQAGPRLDEHLSKEEIKLYAHYISQAKNKCLTPADELYSITSNPSFGPVYEAYQAKLQDMGNVDFGDLIMRSLELLRKHPGVKQAIQKRFKVLLVDEYQDSNLAQFLLLKELYKEHESYLCVVGDEDQSIYGFRGAEVDNIIDFPNLFPGTEIIRLEENYRSTKLIIKAANQVVQHNEARLGKNLWTANQTGQPIIWAHLKNEIEEANFCAQLLKDNALEDTAVLYRNNYQSRAFENAFTRFGIPYRVIGALRFYEREEVKDILAYLGFILNPRDVVSFMRIINKPARGLGKVSIDKILARGGGDLLAACSETWPQFKGKAMANLRAFTELITAARQALHEKPLADFMSSLIHNSGLYGLYELKDQAESTSKALNLNEFVNTTLTYAAGREGLAALLEDIMLSGTEEDPFLKEGKVNLITVHNTKGLEFKRVIITGLEEGLFPYLRDFNFEDKTGIEEERRLFYVAMTRAKERLYLTGCYERRVYGMSKNSYPSRFIAEIPQEFMSRDERPANRELSPWPEHRGWDRSAPEDRERPNELYTDSSAAASDEAEESFADYRKGVGVYHGDYGTGVIVDKWFKNDLCLVKVNFFSGKKAQFILNYSSLERVSLE